MMENETVNQWVDAEGVRALAEELMRPAEPPAPVTPESIYGNSFVGFAEDESAILEPQVNDQDSSLPQQGKPSDHSSVVDQGIERVEIKTDLIPPPKEESNDVAQVKALKISDKPEQGNQKGSGEVDKKSAGKEFSPKTTKDLGGLRSLPPQPPLVARVSQNEDGQKIGRQEGTREVSVTPIPKKAPTEYKVRFKSPFKIVTDLTQARQPQRESFTNKEAAPNRQSGPLKDRPQSEKELEDFANTAKGILNEKLLSEAYCLCNLKGSTYLDKINDKKLVEVACSLARTSSATSSHRGVDDPDSLHVRITNEKVLQVIPYESPYGTIIFAAKSPRPYSKDQKQGIVEIFKEALRGKA